MISVNTLMINTVITNWSLLRCSYIIMAVIKVYLPNTGYTAPIKSHPADETTYTYQYS